MKVIPSGAPAEFTDLVHMILPPALPVASAFNLPPGGKSRIAKAPAWLDQDVEQYEITEKIGADELEAMQKTTPPAEKRPDRPVRTLSLYLKALRAEAP